MGEYMVVNILVVEDNAKLNKKICNLLEIEGYRTYSAYHMEEVREVCESKKPEIVLLDVMLPGGNGYELINQLKNENDCWVIMLTALSDFRSKEISYQSGADDYITKPFDMFELIFKLNAIRKRIVASTKVYVIGDIILDEEASEIFKGEAKLKIPASHSKFLGMLYEKYQTDSYLDKSELQFEYMNEFNDSNRIQTLVSRVRKNLKQIDSKNVLIETVYGKGYSMDIIGSAGRTNV